MHVGPYAEEAPTIARLHRFAGDNGYQLRDKHHEIYLSNPRRRGSGEAADRDKTTGRAGLIPALGDRANENPGVATGVLVSSDAIASDDQEAEGGRITASITWITPFEVTMSVVMTLEMPLRTTTPSTTAIEMSSP